MKVSRGSGFMDGDILNSRGFHINEACLGAIAIENSLGSDAGFLT